MIRLRWRDRGLPLRTPLSCQHFLWSAYPDGGTEGFLWGVSHHCHWETQKKGSTESSLHRHSKQDLLTMLIGLRILWGLILAWETGRDMKPIGHFHKATFKESQANCTSLNNGEMIFYHSEHFCFSSIWELLGVMWRFNLLICTEALRSLWKP